MSTESSKPYYRNKIILFGAGASHGCGDVYPHAPPLGNGLYDRLTEAFPDSWGALPDGLADRFAADFETGMNMLWRDHPDHSAALLQQLGIYVVSFVPATPKGTHYGRIVQRFLAEKRADILYSTLNYDCLLDDELAQAGVAVNYLVNSDNRQGTPLVKLHGSCNWFLDFPLHSRYVSYTADIQFEAPIGLLHNRQEVIDKFTGDTPFYPVIRLYAAEKPAQLAASFFQQLQAQWRDNILHAKCVALIGVRPYPRDTHIWQPLAETSAHLLYIGNCDAFEGWHRDVGRAGKTEFVAERFAEGLEPLLDRLLAEP